MAALDHTRALVRGFIDGTLNAEEHTALETQLRDAEVARHLLRELHLDQAIRVAARSQDFRAGVEAEPAADHQAHGTARLRMRRTPRWRPRLARWSWVRAAAVLLVMALPAWLALTMHVTRQPAAELVVHLGTVQVGDQSRDGASGIEDGQELLVSAKGWASLRLRDGTLIQFAGGSRATFNATDAGVRIALATGGVQAEVRRQPAGRPLVIAGPRAHATVIGTRLAFATAPDGDRLEVSEGLVRLARTGDGARIDVPAGQAVAVGGPGPLALQPIRPPVEPIPEPPRSGLVLWFDPAQGVTLDGRGRVARWDDRSGSGRAVASDAPELRPAVHSDGRPALRFAARANLLTGEVPWPATGAFTVAVAIRAHEMGRWSQCFGWGWGCFSFHTQEDAGVGAPGGGIRFHPGPGPEDIPGGTAVTGRWQRFIVTYGHGVGAFYADGKLIARKAMPAPRSRSELHLGRGEIHPAEPYGFAGDLGELLVYERMLEPGEIAVLDRRLQGPLP
jgi:hypothetical protein